MWLRGFSLPHSFTLNAFFAKYVYTEACVRAKDCARGPESGEALGVCSPAHPLGSIVDEVESPKPSNAVVAIVWYFVTAQGETRSPSGPVGEASATQSLQTKSAGLDHGAVHRPSRQRGHAYWVSCGPSPVRLGVESTKKLLRVVTPCAEKGGENIRCHFWSLHSSTACS